MKNNKQRQNESKKYVTLAILLTFAVAWGLIYWLFIV